MWEGDELTLGCRERRGHQRARSSCVQQREGVLNSLTRWAVIHDLFTQCLRHS